MYKNAVPQKKRCEKMKFLNENMHKNAVHQRKYVQKCSSAKKVYVQKCCNHKICIIFQSRYPPPPQKKKNRK